MSVRIAWCLCRSYLPSVKSFGLKENIYLRRCPVRCTGGSRVRAARPHILSLVAHMADWYQWGSKQVQTEDKRWWCFWGFGDWRIARSLPTSHFHSETWVSVWLSNWIKPLFLNKGSKTNNGFNDAFLTLSVAVKISKKIKRNTEALKISRTERLFKLVLMVDLKKGSRQQSSYLLCPWSDGQEKLVDGGGWPARIGDTHEGQQVLRSRVVNVEGGNWCSSWKEPVKLLKDECDVVNRGRSGDDVGSWNSGPIWSLIRHA